MSALVIELATSRRIAYNGGSPVGTREFTVTGCADEAAVYALFKLDGEPPTNLPNKFSAYPSLSGLVPSVRLVALDFDLRKDEQVLDKWLVSITYREVTLSGTGPVAAPLTQLAPNDEGYLTVRGRTEGGFIEGWRLHDTAEEWDSVYATKTVTGLPIYKVGTPESDIGGRKIDVAGRPVSIETVREQITVDVTLGYIPNVEAIRTLASTRNRSSFLGIPAGSVLFKGAQWSNIAPGKWSVSYEFAADNFSHLIQTVQEVERGQPLLDEGNQAKIVSWVQPFPRLAEHRDLNQYLSTIP
jgi:hypothetical protein